VPHLFFATVIDHQPYHHCCYLSYHYCCCSMNNFHTNFRNRILVDSVDTQILTVHYDIHFFLSPITTFMGTPDNRKTFSFFFFKIKILTNNLKYKIFLILCNIKIFFETKYKKHPLKSFNYHIGEIDRRIIIY
jgi:hypothetical protein